MTSTPAQLMLNIAAVERDTRIGKDALRVWERRYGFPNPQRDTNGERLYPPEQVERLRIVKRLLDAGHRPGRVVALELPELHRLSEQIRESEQARVPPGHLSPGAMPEIEQIIRLVKNHDPVPLRRRFAQIILRIGLARFVLDVAIPLMQEIGQAWASGELHIFEEHLCSEVLETSLRSALAGAPDPTSANRPRVVMSTFPGESHGLGLLMAETLFMVEGCTCMNLGTQTPLHDIINAARAHRADIVAISFSAAANPVQAHDALVELRAMLNPVVQLWAGTSHPTLLRRTPDGVQLLSNLGHIAENVLRWRQQQ